MTEPTRRLLRLALPLWPGFALSIVLGLATVASGVGLLATAAYLIAAAALGPSIADLQVAIVGVRALGLLRGLLRYAERYVSHNMAFQLLAELRGYFFEKLIPRSPAGLDAEHSGELTGRMVDDIEALQYLFIRGIAPPLVALLSTLVLAWLLLPISPPWAIAHVGLMVLAGAILPLCLQRSAKQPSAAWTIARSRMQRTTTEMVQGLPDILAFGQRDWIRRRMEAASTSAAKAQQRAAAIESLGAGLTTALTFLSPVFALWLLQPLVETGAVSGVALVVLVVTALASFEAVEPMAAAMHGLAQSEAAAAHVFRVIDAPPPVDEPAVERPLPARTDLTVDGLCVRYPGSSELSLTDLNFALPAGHRLAVIGPTGAGKSTLMEVLVRFRPYAKGRVEIGGVELSTMSGAQARQIFTLVRQQPAFFSGSLRSNLLLANAQADEIALRQSIELAGLLPFVASLPAGLDTQLGEGGVGLSAGQRQRLALAQALLRNSPILLLDEPTAHIDRKLAREVLNNILDRPGGQSVLLITHDVFGLESMNEILVLEAGRVVQRGCHHVLLAEDGPYRNRWLLNGEQEALLAAASILRV